MVTHLSTQKGFKASKGEGVARMEIDKGGMRTPVSHLRFAMLRFHEQFVLWAARMWVTESCREPAMPARVREAFNVAGVSEATGCLHDLLTIISTQARTTIHFNPVGAPLVAEEEARFLTLIAAARHHACDAYAVTLLTGWLPRAAALQALAPARALALTTFAKLEPCAHQHPVIAVPAASSSPDPGIALLH
jgi:hypothetical protein